jgi:hypothetical protein
MHADGMVRVRDDQSGGEVIGNVKLELAARTFARGCIAAACLRGGLSHA